MNKEENKYRKEKNRKKRKKTKKKNFGLKIFLGSLLVILLSLTAGSFGLYKNIESLYTEAYKDVPNTTAVDFSNKKENFTTLITVTGNLTGEKSCYSVVLAATNKNIPQSNFLNFPVTDIFPDQTKIEEIYAAKGQEGLMEKSEGLLGIKINKVVDINVDKMGELIEASGGISIQNPTTFVSNGYQFDSGTVELTNAEQVTAYLTPINENDKEAAITRIQNVSMVLYDSIQKSVKDTKNFNYNYYKNILYAFGDSVKTNISFKEFRQILFNYNAALASTSKLNFHSTTSEDGKEVISQEEVEKVKEIFETSLK